MRTLVVGAGALGGYFGGRLAEAGHDVTFLVRPRRARQLAECGLRIRSRLGDAVLTSPQIVLAGNLAQPYDLVLLGCKAYDLDAAIATLIPAVGPNTAILPLLNGMRHLDVLDRHFGSERVLGGQCIIAATLNEDGEILHLNEAHTLGFGERDGSASARVRAIAALMQTARFNAPVSTTIVLDMWEKWTFIATLAGCTCLMRASVGEIQASPGGREFTLALLEEVRSIARAAGYDPRPASLDRTRNFVMSADSPLTASMLRDMESNAPVEADHIIGDLLERGSGLDVPLLRIVYTHLKSYEARRRSRP
jgi:2-dehydropantoate 2-reductase